MSRLHYIDERPDRNSTNLPRKFPTAAAIPKQTGFGLMPKSGKRRYRRSGSVNIRILEGLDEVEEIPLERCPRRARSSGLAYS